MLAPMNFFLDVNVIQNQNHDGLSSHLTDVPLLPCLSQQMEKSILLISLCCLEAWHHPSLLSLFTPLSTPSANPGDFTF